ncbi:MAG: hypothetical protein IJP20_02640 [Clostridia bacterium]|nr:hypothetical protein [Clostridia bacterium]
MSESIKLFGVAILCAIACVIIKNYKNEFHVTAKISAIIIIFGIIIGLISPIVKYLKNLAGQALSEEYVEIILKTLAVSYITNLSSEVCKDCGEGNIASGVEMIGKLEILLLSIPLIESILQLAGELLVW